MSLVYDEFEALRFLFQDKETAANALEAIQEVQGKEFLQEKVECKGTVEMYVPAIDLNMIGSKLNWLLMQSTENMSKANKETLREILSEVNYAKKRQK